MDDTTIRNTIEASVTHGKMLALIVVFDGMIADLRQSHKTDQWSSDARHELVDVLITVRSLAGRLATQALRVPSLLSQQGGDK